MTQLWTLRRTQQLGIGFLVVVLVVGVGVALFQPLLGLLTALLGALLVGVPALVQAGEQRRQPTPAHVASASLPREPVAQCRVWTADGTPQQALVVPLERTDEYRLVLTVAGYALVNDEGLIVYRLKA